MSMRVREVKMRPNYRHDLQTTLEEKLLQLILLPWPDPLPGSRQFLCYAVNYPTYFHAAFRPSLLGAQQR